jgi:hypothetical protein
MGGRINVKADDVFELVGEFRILGELEGSDTMRSELMSLQDALHRTQADAGSLGQHPAGPMRGLARRSAQRQIDNPLHVA